MLGIGIAEISHSGEKRMKFRYQLDEELDELMSEPMVQLPKDERSSIFNPPHCYGTVAANRSREERCSR